MVARARTSIDRPVSVLLDEVRSSIDYFRNQPGAARLGRVVVTGGTAQLPGLPERLSALVGVPVEPAYMHDLLRIGDIGFPAEELPRLEPYLPAPVGLALGGGSTGTVINVIPRTRRTSSKARPRFDQRILAGAMGAIVVFGGLTYMAHSSASSAKSKEASAETQVKKLQNQLGASQLGAGQGASSSVIQAEAAALLAGDTAWPSIVDTMTKVAPPGVRLYTLQGQRSTAPPPIAGSAATTGGGAAGTASSTGAKASTATSSASGASGATGTASASPSPASLGGLAPVSTGPAMCASLPVPVGTITATGGATSLAAIAQYIDALKKDTDIAAVWVSSAQRAGTGLSLITFQLTAQLAKTARGHRLETFLKEPPCK
jgi:type IV pilus assembly protein PilM